MKEKIINVLKWFFIVLGVAFLVQILIVITAFVTMKRVTAVNFETIETNIKKPSEFIPIINYAQEYYDKNGKFPQNIDGIKLKKNLEYDYKTTKDLNCYTVTVKSKKNDITKQYQCCKMQDKNSNSNSESYVEYNN